jgi:THO complex subunit 5
MQVCVSMLSPAGVIRLLLTKQPDIMMVDDELNADRLVDALNDLVDSTTTASPQFQLESSALFACLKSANRSVNFAIRARKQETADARLAMDHTYLRLQNLLYERRHLERDIEKCNQFA